MKTEDVLMVLLTIITCSKNWTLEINLHQLASSLWFLSFKEKWNIHGAIHEKFRKRTLYHIDFRVSYIRLKDVTIIQNILLSSDPVNVTNRSTEL